MDADRMSVDDWGALFSRVSPNDLARLQSIVDRIDAGAALTNDDRQAILGMFARAGGDCSDAA